MKQQFKYESYQDEKPSAQLVFCTVRLHLECRLVNSILNPPTRYHRTRNQLQLQHELTSHVKWQVLG